MNKLIDLIAKCKEILRRDLVKEGYENDDEIFQNSEFEVTHRKEEERDIIVAYGSQEWVGSKFEEEIINEIEEEILKEYPNAEFKWYNNLAGGYWSL